MFSGKGRFVSAGIVSLIIPLMVAGQQGKSYRHHIKGDLEVNPVEVTENKIIIHYLSGDIDFRSVKNSEGDFYRISIPGHNITPDPGKPELPVLSRLITVPEGSNITVSIEDVRSEKITPPEFDIRGLLYPRQADRPKSDQQERQGFMIDRELYSKRGLIKSDTVRIEFIGKIRNKQIAAVHISPVRYNPFRNELELITSMKIEILFGASKTGSDRSDSKGSLLFGDLTGKGTLNYNPDEVITGYSDKPVGMVILADTAFRKLLKPFIAWKTQKGFRVTALYKGSAFAGTTFTQIKDTLTKIYNSATPDNPAPEYLLIVGNPDRIPGSGGTDQLSDLYWGEFDGAGDYLPDMFIGRLPVADTGQLRAVLKKIIQYEKFEFADTNNFYARSLVTAGYEPGYADLMNGQVRYATKYYLNQTYKVDGHVFYTPQSASSEDTIKKLINNGISFINYTGHGSVSGWLDPLIKVPEIAQFKNKNMYPFVISNACLTGYYDEPESMGNKWIVSADKGAVGFIGCSNDSYWNEDYYWAVGVGTPEADPDYGETGLGAFDRLFHTHSEKPSEWFITMSQVNYAGNLSVSSSTSTKKKYYWEIYNLLGDPSVIPYVGVPDSFNINIPDRLPNGITSYSVTTDPFSYVAVSHRDTLWDATYASPSGSAVLDLPGISNDSCLLVITGQNKVPLIKKIYFSDVNDEFINLTASGINDAAANNNGLADFGETVFLRLTIGNLGLTDATDLSAKISTTSEWAEIISDSVYIGTLQARSQTVLSDKFEVAIASVVPDKGYITFNLRLADSRTVKDFTVDLCIHAPELEITGYTIEDSGTGNNNLYADPGETVMIVVAINNSGSSDISGILNITNSPAGVLILQNPVNTGIIRYGQTTYVQVPVALSTHIPNGGSFEISTLLDCTPYITSRSFSIPVGKTRESFEYQSFTIFPWQVSATYPWTITDGQAYEGTYSAQSGIITNNKESVLRLNINVSVADTLSFRYRVSSEKNYDFLILRLNGIEKLKVSGETTGWAEMKVVLNEGFNLLEWIYRKDESVASGNDCAWIDYIGFPALSFKKTDLKTNKIVTPEPNKNYSMEPITAEIINLGSDTIRSLNLAYVINTDSPVTEHFVKTIDPGDTASLEFTVPANLTGNGTYILKVYGFNNSDGYAKNDTTSLVILNTAIKPVESNKNRISVMPNPFSESFRIVFESGSSDQIVIDIFDTAGKLLWEETRAVIPGENSLTVTPEILPPGFYTLFLKGKTIYKASRLIKN